MIEVYAYDLPHRRGLILRRDETDTYSEISPLPGFSPETFEQALTALFERNFDLYPSVSFGIDMLYVDIEPIETPYAMLLTGTPQQIIDKALVGAHCGVRTCKVKMKHITLDESIAFLPLLLKLDLSVRLDFNQAWSTNDCLELSHAFEPNTFEYFEDPTPDLLTFCKHTTQPVALDESMRNHDDIWGLPNVSTFVVKPPLFGNVGDCLELAQQASRQGKNIVLSSSYESGVGLINLIKLSQLLPQPHSLGIDTYQTPDILTSPLSYKNGICSITDTAINHKTLERLGVVSFDALIQ